MKTHITYAVYCVEPCQLGDNHRFVLAFYSEKEALEFINDWYKKYDYSFVCLVLMKVLS